MVLFNFSGMSDTALAKEKFSMTFVIFVGVGGETSPTVEIVGKSDTSSVNLDQVLVKHSEHALKPPANFTFGVWHNVKQFSPLEVILYPKYALQAFFCGHDIVSE